MVRNRVICFMALGFHWKVSDEALMQCDRAGGLLVGGVKPFCIPSLHHSNCCTACNQTTRRPRSSMP